MIECTNFRYIRRKHYVAADMKDLFERIPLKIIIGFLKEARLYYVIWLFIIKLTTNNVF